MNEQSRPTAAGDVDVPPENILVTLSELKTRSGEPVRVLCVPVDQEDCTRILELLPGERIKGAKPDPAAERLRNARILKECGRPLIELGTALTDGAGELVKPAFYFGPTTPHPLAIPGRALTMAEASDLMETILKVSGFLGGAAEAARFHARDGARGNGGLGALAVLHGAGKDAAGGAA